MTPETREAPAPMTALDQPSAGPDTAPHPGPPTGPDRTLTPAARAALAGSVPPSTRRAYAADWRAFAAWCASTGRTALPATPETLVEYVTHLTVTPRERTGRPAAPASIERALAAIRTLHGLAGAVPPEAKGARRVLDAHRHALALADDPAATPRRAEAALPERLRAMVAAVDRSTPAGLRDVVILLLGYATAARVSELAALTVDRVRETEEGLLVTLYRRKIKKWTECAVPYGADPATCPVRATRALLAFLAGHGRTGGPLFVRIDRHGRIAPPMTRNGRPIGDPTGRMTAEAIAEAVTRAARAAGLPGRWTGHSLRRGFATAARRAEHTLEEIARHGGWDERSRALLGYIDDADKWSRNPVVGL